MGEIVANHLRQRTGGSRCQCFRVSCAAGPLRMVVHSGPRMSWTVLMNQRAREVSAWMAVWRRCQAARTAAGL